MRYGQNRGAAAEASRRAIGLVVPHGSSRRELEEVREVDPDGRIVVHHRTRRFARSMRKSGAIDAGHVRRSTRLPGRLHVANLDPLRALSILRVPGTGREPDLNERQLDARRRVHAAMRVLGGIASPAGSCVWHVVGLQRSVREWAMRQGWCGRPVDRKRLRAS